MNGATNRAVAVMVGLGVLLIVAGFGSIAYAAFPNNAVTGGFTAALGAPAGQAAQPAETPVHVSSRGDGVVEALPLGGEQAPTPLPVSDPSGGVLPATGRNVDPALYIVLGVVGLAGVALILLGLTWRKRRNRDATS